MQLKNLQEICETLCALLDAEINLTCESDVWIQTWTVQGVTVQLGYAPALSSRTACLVTELGRLDQRHELRDWRSLLEENHARAGDFGPRFGRNPATGSVDLQYPFVLESAQAVQLHTTLLEMVATAYKWRGKFST
jgi:hypothetical protein